MCEQFAPLRGRLAGQGQGRRVTVSFSSAQQQPRCHKVHFVYQKHNVLHSSSPSRLHVTADVLPGFSRHVLTAVPCPCLASAPRQQSCLLSTSPSAQRCSWQQADRRADRQDRQMDGLTGRPIHRQTGRQADRQADRQTGRWINRQDATGLNTCSWAGRGGHRNTCSELTSCYLLKNFARIDNQL